jgi:NTE family protein
LAILREERSLARFQRVSLVLSGGGALGAYQAGAYSAMEAAGFEPDWVAGVAIGAVNAAIIAGNPPRRRVERLRSFWTRVGSTVAHSKERLRDRLLRPLRRRRGGRDMVGLLGLAPCGLLDSGALRSLVAEHVDFARVNAGATRLSLAAVHLATGAEITFDNDRHVIGLDHVLASAAPSAGCTPVWIVGEPYGNTSLLPVASLGAIFEDAAPADTLLFLVDGFDPDPAARRGTTRAGQQIAGLRRGQDLRRVIGLIGERLPAELRADPELRGYLAHGTAATMNLVRLVHESSAGDLVRKLSDYAPETALRRWRAGECDMAASLAKPAWLAPPPRRKGVVIHELRGTGTSRAE